MTAAALREAGAPEVGHSVVCDQVLASVSERGAGPSYSVRALSDGLARRGAAVRILTVEGWRAEAAPASEAPILAFPWDFRTTPGLRALCLSSQLQAELRRAAARECVLHAHGLWLAPNLYPAWAAQSGRAKLVLSPRGMLGAEALEYSRLKKAVVWAAAQRAAAARAACLHATGGSEYEAIRARGLANPVAVIPNGVDLPAATTPATKRTVLSLGRVHPKKGLDLLLRAWAEVEARHPDWTLRIVGPAELGHDAELRALAASLGLSRAHVEGPAYGAEKEAAYRACALFVLPTRNENFAMTVAEALAHGRPVISTRGAPWSGLQTEGCGWWVDGAVAPIAAALDAAMGAPLETLSAMGARGRAWMARDFSWDRVAAEMMDVYRWVLGQADRPDTVRLD